MDLTRKDFIVLLAGAAVGAACGGSSSAPGNCLANGTGVSIEQNTGHSLVVSKEDVAAGAAKTYDIRGTDQTHTHSVTLTAADMQSLQKNQGVLETSSTGGTPSHTHLIHVSCA